MHPIQKRVRAVGTTARLLTLAYGLAWVVMLAGTAALLLGLADYVLHFRDFGVRFIGWCLLVLVAAASGYRFVLPVVGYHRSAVQVALRIEQRFPQLHGRLSSAVAFLDQTEDDATAGSAVLRRTVVAETTAAIERLSLLGAIDFRRPLRMVLLAVLVGELLAGAFVLDAPGASLAAWRLVAPWSSAAWPRRNDLEFVDAPDRLAAGRNLELKLVDRNGHLPDVVKFQYRYLGDDDVQVKEMKFLDDKMVQRLENVTRSLEYRALGGDDDTPWRNLTVVEPPQITSLEIRLTPPAYTAWKPETMDSHIRALADTRVEMVAVADQPLTSAQLNVETEDGVTHVPVTLDADGHTLHAPADSAQPWLVEKSGSFWLELVGDEPLPHGGEKRWQIRAVVDQPPTVAIEQPAANVYVTPSAVLPLAASTKDDLAIQLVELRYLRSGQSDRGEQTVELFRGAAVPVSSGKGLNAADGGDARNVNMSWNLADLAGLAPGETVDIHVAAHDYRPQMGQSTTRRLTIISTEELEDRVAQRQTYLLGQLAEALRVQREARSQVGGLEIQWAETKRFDKPHIDQLQSSELNQRQVQRLLGDENDGARAVIAQALTDLDNNRIDSPEARRRLQELATELRRIEQQHLTVIQSDLINGLKVARMQLAAPPAAGNDEPDSVDRLLTSAGQQQDAVIAALEELRGEFSQWDSYRRFAREISRIHREQLDLTRDTEATRLTTLGRDVRELSPQQRADLKKLTQLQGELGRRFDKVLGGMQQMLPQLQTDEPLAAETIADALDTAQRLAISGQMRESARGIENNQIGQASEHQQQAASGLEQLLDVLASRREHELERRVKQLRQAADDLDKLIQRQEANRQQLEDAAKNTDTEQRKRQLERLTREQAELADELKRLTRRLDRLQADAAADAADKAAREAGDAAAAGRADDAATAAQQARAAENSLADARQKLADEIKQTEQDLLEEQMQRLEQTVAALVTRQQRIIEETQRLNELRTAQGQWQRAQLTSLRQLSLEQRTLAAETGVLAGRLTDAAAFQLALRSAIREMLRAASHLDRWESGPETQQAERAALTRLQQLLSALTPDKDQPPQEGPPPENPPEEALPGDVLRVLAELRLLKLMQEEVNRRTAELATARAANQGELTDEQQQELDDLATDQGRLAELILQLGQTAAPDETKPVPDAATPGDLNDAVDKALDDILQ